MTQFQNSSSKSFQLAFKYTALLLFLISLLFFVFISIVQGSISASNPSTNNSLDQQIKLVPADVASGKEFGHSTAIFEDTLIVGAPGDTTNGLEGGAAYIFTFDGVSWNQQAKLIASDTEAWDRFGSHVAISGDTVVVGAHEKPYKVESGAAYVFTRNGTEWTQQAKLVANDAQAGDQYGVDVAISEDTILVGSHRDDDNGVANSGSVYIYVRNGTDWNQQVKITASDPSYHGQFGGFVALSGETAVIGVYGDDVNGYYSGSAYVFTRNGTVWSEQARLLANDGKPYDYFGGSVDISNDTIIVGGFKNNATIFTRNEQTWSLQAELIEAGGSTVALSGDTAIVGRHVGDEAAYIFSRDGTSWNQEAKLVAFDREPDDNFGWGVSIFDRTVAIGALDDDVGEFWGSGSVYVFTFTQNVYLPIVKR